MRIKLLVLSVLLILPSLAFSLGLKDAVTETVKSNPDIIERVKYYRSVRQDLNVARSGFFPKVDVFAGYGAERTYNSTTGYDDKRLYRRELAVVLTQDLFVGFRTLNDMKRQKARIASAAHSAMEKANDVGLRMIEVYLELLKQHDLLKLAEENLKTHEEINKQIKDRIESGVGTKSELDQSDSRLALANSNVIVQMNNFEDAKTNFKKVYGEYVEAKDLAAPKIDFVLPKTLEEANEAAFVNHPSLSVQNANVRVAKANYKINGYKYFPRVYIEARQEWNRNVSGVYGRNENASIMLKASWNLFNGGADFATRQGDISRVNQENQVFKSLKRSVEESLRLSWMAYKMIGKQIDYLKRHRDLSKSTLDSYHEEFKLGRRTLLDILDTEEEYYSANRELAVAGYDYTFAQYRVISGVGKLMEVLDIQFKDMVGLGTTQKLAKEKDKLPKE